MIDLEAKAKLEAMGVRKLVCVDSEPHPRDGREVYNKQRLIFALKQSLMIPLIHVRRRYRERDAG